MLHVAAARQIALAAQVQKLEVGDMSVGRVVRQRREGDDVSLLAVSEGGFLEWR